MSTENASGEHGVSPVLEELGPMWKEVGIATELWVSRGSCRMGMADKNRSAMQDG